MNDTLFRSAAEAAELVRRKEVSARELTQLLLARIDAVNPAVNAVVELRSEEALQEAAEVDRVTVPDDGATGPLHGVPMTVKESFNVAGLHTTWGNPAFKDYVANADATLVRRLKQAGAIIVGKTNVHFMLADFAQTANELYGVTNNPWDTARTPGGSSGGGAAALAAGMTFLEHGSDLVGSIRIPASFCGVYGLKPSVGIVPLTGFQVPGPPAPPSEMLYMSAVGPLGRSAPDLRIALKVTAGPEPPAVNAYSWTLAPARHRRLADFRAGVVLDHEHAPVSSEVAAVLSGAVDALARAGTTVVEGWPEGVDPVEQSESFAFHIGLFFAFQNEAQTSPGRPSSSNRRTDVWPRALPGAATSTRSTSSCARRTSRRRSRTTAGRSKRGRSQPLKGSGRTPTSPSGSRTRHCPACLPSSHRSAEHPAASPSVYKSSVRSTKTTRPSPSPKCSPT